MYKYKDRLCLITGASSGLGWHLAHAYYKAGAQLALVGRDKEALAGLVQDLDSGQQNVRYFYADLFDTAQIPTLVEDVVKAFGKSIDVLVCCAGMSCYGEVERSPFEVIKQVINVNCLSGIRLVQLVLEPMKLRRSGQIIWIGSGSAIRGVPRAAVYSASKAAVKSFCEALGSELHAFGVDVLLVMPGALKTEFHEQQANYSSDQRLRSPLGPSEPEFVAQRIVRAGQRQQSLLVHGRYTRLGRHLAYWAPWLLDRLLRWQI